MKKKTKKRVMAQHNRIDAETLQPYVLIILAAVGHTEALITDESMLWDFNDITHTKPQTDKWLKRVSKKIGFEVKINDYIVDIAEKMKKNEGE